MRRRKLVCLSKVDKETGVAFFRFASTTTFASFSWGALVYNLDIIVIFIIVDHPVELQGYDTLDDIFLIQPFQFTVDRRHQTSDFLLVHFHFLDLVHQVEQLLLTDLLTGRHLAFIEFLVDDSFDLADLAFFPYVADRDSDTRFSRTARTSAAVGIRFYLIRQTVIDYMG